MYGATLYVADRGGVGAADECGGGLVVEDLVYAMVGSDGRGGGRWVRARHWSSSGNGGQWRALQWLREGRRLEGPAPELQR